MLCTGGLYAPTIRHRDGTFYVICTNIIHPGSGKDVPQNFVVSTRDIWSGNWSDPVNFAFNGIDPSIFFEDDGRVFVQGSAAPGPYTKINQFQIDLETGEKLSEERTIWTGTGGVYPEGPHMYKRNGWYYILISEGGTHEGHMITIARSKDIWGPYDPCPHNPILTARGTNEYIRYTGHCDVFQDDEGQWWGVCLGVRKDAGGRFVMGRESFLTRGSWDGDWLSLERVKSNPSGLVRAEGREALSAVAPNVEYLYIRDAHLSNYKISGTDGSGSVITLTSSPVDLSAPEASPTFMGKRQRLLSGKTGATIPNITSQTWRAAKLRCGIACYKDEHRYLRIYLDASNNHPAVAFEFVNNAKKISRMERHDLRQEDAGNPSTLALRIEYTEQEYRLLYSTRLPDQASVEDADWTCLAVVDTLCMTDPDFVGPVMGAFATSEVSNVEVELRGVTID